MGIEPTSAAWEAAILPLNHARSGLPYQTDRNFGKSASVGHAGQSISFHALGICVNCRKRKQLQMY